MDRALVAGLVQIGEDDAAERKLARARAYNGDGAGGEEGFQSVRAH